jgi:hypothetical protein
MGPKVQEEPCPWFGRVKVWSQTKQNKNTYINVRFEFEFELKFKKWNSFQLNMNLIVFKLHSTSFTIFIQMKLNFSTKSI